MINMHMVDSVTPVSRPCFDMGKKALLYSTVALSILSATIGLLGILSGTAHFSSLSFLTPLAEKGVILLTAGCAAMIFGAKHVLTSRCHKNISSSVPKKVYSIEETTFQGPVLPKGYFFDDLNEHLLTPASIALLYLPTGHLQQKKWVFAIKDTSILMHCAMFNSTDSQLSILNEHISYKLDRCFGFGVIPTMDCLHIPKKHVEPTAQETTLILNRLSRLDKDAYARSAHHSDLLSPQSTIILTEAIEQASSPTLPGIEDAHRALLLNLILGRTNATQANSRIDQEGKVWEINNEHIGSTLKECLADDKKHWLLAFAEISSAPISEDLLAHVLSLSAATSVLRENNTAVHKTTAIATTQIDGPKLEPKIHEDPILQSIDQDLPQQMISFEPLGAMLRSDDALLAHDVSTLRGLFEIEEKISHNLTDLQLAILALQKAGQSVTFDALITQILSEYKMENAPALTAPKSDNSMQLTTMEDESDENEFIRIAEQLFFPSA